MKKIAVFAAVLLVIAAIIRSLGLGGPSTLSVEAALITDGRSLQNAARIYVGHIPDDPDGRPTLGNMTLIKPVGGSPLVYRVPSDHNVAAIALVDGMLPQRIVVRVPGGNHETHKILLDDRRGRPVFSIAANIPWADNFPGVRYLKGSDVTGEIDDLSAPMPETLLYGRHQIAMRFDYPSEVYVDEAISAPQTLVMDADEVALAIPVTVQAVRPDFQQWDRADLMDTYTAIFSLAEGRHPIAAARVENQDAPLVFLAQDIVATYAVAVIRDRKIIAIQDIGLVGTDAPVDVVIERTGDAALCAEFGSIFLKCAM